MARLPTVGGDSGNWGTVLNEFLQVSHNSDGTPKNLFYNVKDYGATGNGTTDDTSAIQAAFTAATSGGVVFFPEGKYKITSEIAVATSVFVMGAGRRNGADTQGTRIFTTAIINGFVVDADRVVFQDLSITNRAAEASVTSGAGIKFNTGNWHAIERVAVAGWYYGIWHVNGIAWTHTNNNFTSNIKYGLYIQNVDGPDTGDTSVVGCAFDEALTTPADAAIRFESGGGFKVTNTKFLHHNIGIDLAEADDTAGVDFQVSNCSIEGQVNYGIRLGRAGTTGTFKRVVINGNQFAGSDAGGTTTDVIRCEAGVSHVIITNNFILGPNTSNGVHVVGGTTGGDFVNISGNHFDAVSVGVQVDSTAIAVTCGQNTYANVSNLVINQTALNLSGREFIHDYRRSFSAVTSTSSFTNLWRVEWADRTGGEIEVLISGIVNSAVGGFTGRWVKLAHRASGGAAVTLTDAVAPATAGIAFQVQFDTSSQNGSVIVGVCRDAGDGGASISGHCQIRVSGQVTRIIRS